jgi:hypothetical protein
MVSQRFRDVGRASALSAIGVALLLFAAVFAATTVRLLRATDGHLTYGLDDAYIHMAIGKNLALHGNWGVQAHAFAAASSSPLWTALLGVLFAVAGVHEIVPLLLNLAVAGLCIVALGLALERHRLPGIGILAVLASLILLTPLVPMVWIGMEHTLHVLVVLITAWAAREVVQRDSSSRRLQLYALGATAVAVRYEGLFVVAGCALALLLARKVLPAAATVTAALVPVIGVGLWNLSHGWFFLPASVMMKQTVLPAGGGTMVGSMMSNLLHANPPAAFTILVLTGAVLLVLRTVRSSVAASEPLLVMFLAAALLHLSLARFGWLFRYESYLIALGVYAVGVAAFAEPEAATEGGVRSWHRGDPVLILAPVLLVLLILYDRSFASNVIVAETAGHIYRQQRQMAAFVGRYYDDRAVALNDIGAVSYFTHARVHDLMGLGSLQSAAARREGRFDVAFIEGWLRSGGVDVAIVYDDVFQGRQQFQKTWVRVGTWDTDASGTVEDAVTFFAADARSAALLRQRLDEFRTALPPRVVTELAHR